MTIAFVTLGCKVNQVDSDSLRQRMEAEGYTTVSPDAYPDVLVINSCAVTAESERKTRQKLRHFRALYRDCVLVLTGCAVQVSKAEAYPEADIALGHRDISKLAQYVDEFLFKKIKVANISPHQHGELFEDDLTQESADRTRAHLKIEDGCNQFCSYCIIPHARGRVRSMPLEVMRQEVLRLDSQGFRELVLVGINLAAYGSDLGYDLADALLKTENLSNIKRVRLGSLEPDLLTLPMLERISYISSIELCPHFHLSLQSGCDSVLNRMNRHYSTEEYYELVQLLKARFPTAAITTDIMVGFPGETDAEFEQSLAFARKVRFAKIHVFPFSARPGTPAAAMQGQISRSVKQMRTKEMLQCAKECNDIFLNSQIGRTLHVLPEEPHPAGGMQGYSAEYAPVHIKNAGKLRNQLVPVRIESVQNNFCFGNID